MCLADDQNASLPVPEAVADPLAILGATLASVVVALLGGLRSSRAASRTPHGVVARLVAA